MKIIRVLFSILLLAIVIAGFAALALIYFVDPNKLKPIIAQEVNRQTGYELTIDGDLAWSFYPKPSIKIVHMTLKAPDQNATFLDLKNVKIATKLSEIWTDIKNRESLQGDIYISAITLGKLHLQNAHVGMRWQGKTLTLKPLTAKLYDGTLEGIARGKRLEATPIWDFNIAINHLQLEPLLNDVNGSDSKIKLIGTTRLILNGTTQGKDKLQIMQNLNGTSQFAIENGAVSGIDLNYLVQTADAIYSRTLANLPLQSGEAQTRFDSLTGSAIISTGIITTNNLVLAAPAFTSRGSGNINLVNQRIDYRLLISPLNTTKLKGTVPVLVQGDVAKPSVKLDESAIATLLADEKFEAIKEKVNKEIKKLPSKANKFLERLLN